MGITLSHAHPPKLLWGGGGFLCLMAYQHLWLFNAKAILIEGQLWYYLTYSERVYKRVCTFPKGISPKVNVITQLEFELAYYDITFYDIIDITFHDIIFYEIIDITYITFQYVSHNTIDALPLFFKIYFL